MNRYTVSLAVLIVAAMTVVAVPAAALGSGGLAGGQGPASDVTDGAANETSTEATANGTDGEPPPGSTLAGVVGVQEAEIEGELESRGFEIALNRSGYNASKQAGVIASQVTDLEARLEELRERKNELDRAREKGNITDGAYRAQIAQVATRIATVQRLANQTANATQGIPDETLRERGVDASAIRELGRNARNLSGPEVAAIAREIAGPGAGKGLGGGPPANRTRRGEGPPGNGNGQADGPPGNSNGQADGPPGNGNGQGDGPPGNGNGQGDGPPGNGDGQPGAGSPTTPGPNASNNGSDGGPPETGVPAGDGPAMDGPGDEPASDNETAPENSTEPGVPDDGGTSDGRTVTDGGNADTGQVRDVTDDAVVRTEGAAVVPSVGD
jgi:hypothetical protein